MKKNNIHQSLLSLKEQKSAQNFFKSKKEYEKSLLHVQTELLRFQQKLFQKRKKVMIVLEGPDASGKGGVIRRFTEHLDPRGVKVHATRAPDLHEVEQNYFERFFKKLPLPGEICVFDRSWYGRVLVERVENLIPKKDWIRAYPEINGIEKMWIEDGVLLCKYFLDISHEEQLKRFQERRNNPLKAWKYTDEDIRNRNNWTSYTEAQLEMIQKTSTKISPWVVLPANSKWFCRVTLLEDMLKRIKKFLQ